jgi:cytidyltransferase-like protein
MIIVATSGGYDPIHLGHIQCMELAKQLAGDGGKLVVIVNTDEFLIRKKGYAFMPLKERIGIVQALRCVDEVVTCIDKDQSVSETLRMLKPNIFAKGGDRHAGEIPESTVCKECGIEIIDGLGDKIQSSSWLVNNLKKHQSK